MLAEQCPYCLGAAGGTQQRPLHPRELSSGPGPSLGTWYVLHHPTTQSAGQIIGLQQSILTPMERLGIRLRLALPALTKGTALIAVDPVQDLAQQVTLSNGLL